MPGSDGKAERVLVTGAEGCIGSWAVRRLLAADVPVVACDLAPAPAAHLSHRPCGSAGAARLPARRPHRAVGDRRARLRPRHDADHPPRSPAGAVRRRQSARRRRGQRGGHRARPRGGAPGRDRARYLVRELDRGVRQRRSVGPARDAVRRLQGGERGDGALLRARLRHAERRTPPLRRVRPEPRPRHDGSHHPRAQGGGPGRRLHDPVPRRHRPAVRRRRRRSVHRRGPRRAGRRARLRPPRRSARCRARCWMRWTRRPRARAT